MCRANADRKSDLMRQLMGKNRIHLGHMIVMVVLIVVSMRSKGESCESWFLKSGVTPGTSSCEIECAIIPVDLATFNCGLKCESLCKTVLPRERLDNYLYLDAATRAEKDLISKYPMDALKVYRLKFTATESTKRIFGRNGWNDESDAFRHFLWSGLMAKELGVEHAKFFLEAHEKHLSQDPKELAMDSHNNELGVTAGLKLKEAENFVEALERDALEKIKSGDLKVTHPKGKVPQWK